MGRPLFPDADRYGRLHAFADLVARAELAPPAQREHLIGEAAAIAVLHRELTGTPLWPAVDAYLHELGVPERQLHWTHH
jgi:hypothetical protein